MKKLTPQMKINIIAGISVSALLIFWVLFYLPSKRVIKELKSELGLVQSQIQQIEGRVSVGGKLEEGIRLLDERYTKVNSKFPQKEEEALGVLSDLAQDYKVEIQSLMSQPKKLFNDENSKEVTIEGKVCQVILVSVEAKASYLDLVEYLDALKDVLPAYMTIERMGINKDASGSLKLHVSLDLALYLLS